MPFLALLLDRKAHAQHGRAAIVDFLRIIALILLEREEQLPFVFHPLQNPRSKTLENAVNILEISAWKLKFKIVLGRSQRVIRESTSMLQFWVHKLPGLQKENKFPPPRRMPSWNTSLLSDLEDYTETWRQPPKSPNGGMEQRCNTVRVWIPKLASKVCGRGKGGQTDFNKNRLLCSKRAGKHQPCCSPPPCVASSLTLCLFSSAIPSYHSPWILAHMAVSAISSVVVICALSKCSGNMLLIQVFR